MSLLKKLAGETMIYGVSSILSRLLNYVILTPFLTRVFLPVQYGVVTEMYAYIALLMVFFTYRMETTFFRFGSEKGAIDNVFSTAAISLLVSTFFYATLFIVLAEPIAIFLNYPDHTDYVIWFTMILALDTLVAIPFARLRLDNRPIKFAVVKTMSILVNIFFIFFFLKICPNLIENGWTGLEKFYDSENRIAYVFISNFLGSLSVMLLLAPEYLKVKWKFDSVLWKKMMLYALPLIVVGFAGVFNQLMNIPMLKYFLPGTDASVLAKIGEYGACYKIAILMSLFIQAFNYAAEPFFFRNADRSDSKNIYAQVGQAFALVGSLVFLGIMLYLDLIQHFIGKDFRVGLHVVPVLLIAFLFLGLYYNFSIWYKLKDKTHIGAYISLGGVAITIVLNVLLIPSIGYMGSAWAALTCYLFMAMASYVIGKKYYPIPYPIGKIFLYIALSVGTYYLSIFIRPYLGEQFFYILIVNTILLGIYVMMIYQLEKSAIRKLMNRPEESRGDVLDD